jgi:hypothetical protein
LIHFRNQNYHLDHLEKHLFVHRHHHDYHHQMVEQDLLFLLPNLCGLHRRPKEHLTLVLRYWNHYLSQIVE